MGLFSAVRPMAAVMDSSTHPSVGSSAGNAPAAQSGGKTASLASPDSARPVTPTQASGFSNRIQSEDGLVAESARARVEAAQRAYMMTLRAAGLNPLANPVP